MKKRVFMTLVLSVLLIMTSVFTSMADESAGILEFKEYPKSYKEAAEHQGAVTKITYNNGVGEKFFNIYLPYGYDDNSDSYNVLYIVHGGGGDPGNYIKPDKATAVQKVIDHMIEDGICDPFIMVSVSWSPAEGEDASENYESDLDYTVLFAQDELSRCIVSYVDENYRTNADREHRAFCGFSMGGVTTWNVLMYDLKDFEALIPLSGDSWVIEKTGGKTKAAETAAAIADAITAQGMTSEDFRIFAATGSVDYALENLEPQMTAMQDNEMFKYGENTFFGIMEGISHGDPNARYYLYTIIPMLW